MRGRKKTTKKKKASKSIFDIGNVAPKPKRDKQPLTKPNVERMKKDIDKKTYEKKERF
jgi:hypothetical protein